CAYGWAVIPEQSGMRRLPHETPIDNLYLTGHWTIPGPGVCAVVASGWRVANRIAAREPAPSRAVDARTGTSAAAARRERPRDRHKGVFVTPHPPERHGEESISVIVQMPLNLAYLAALTPHDAWERDLVDETIELALDEHGEPIFDADLVAITSLTYQSPRAYEIAAACRRRGMKVVMGG